MELFIGIVLGLVSLYLFAVTLFPNAVPFSGNNRAKKLINEMSEATQISSFDPDETADIRRDVFRELPSFQRAFFSLPLLKNLYPLLLQSGRGQSISKHIVIYLVMTGLFVALLIRGGGQQALALFAPFMAYLFMSLHLKKAVRKRNHKFIDMFPDVLDTFVRGIRSGFPVTAAFKMIADNMEPPVSNEFKQVVSEISAGRTTQESLNRLAMRINEPDVHFFVVVLKVQQETGGNLAEVVSNLSGVIRKRKMLRLKIRALTSEGRATGIILGALPVFVFAVLYIIRRDYLEPLWLDPTGRIVFGVAIGLVISCAFIVKSMINIDI